MSLVFILFVIAIIALLLPSQLTAQKDSLRDVDSSLTDRLEQLKKDYQFRIKELARRKKSGDLAEDEWQTLSSELELETANSIDATKLAQANTHEGKSWLSSALMVSVVSVVAVISYLYFGSFEQAKKQFDLSVRINSEANLIETLNQNLIENKNQESINMLYLAMRTKVDMMPDDVDAWRSLSIFNSSYNRIPEALNAIKFAVKLAPNDLDLKIERAHILALSEDRSDLFASFRIINEVLKVNDKHEGALLLMANLSFNFGLYSKAINSWNVLIESLTPENEMYGLLKERVAEAEQLILKKQQDKQESRMKPGSTVKPSSSTEQAATTNSAAKIQLSIIIPDEIALSLTGNESLFIFAKAVGAGNFPVAVIRTTLRDMKKSYILTDKNAMRPEMKLSSFDKVIVTARISVSGNAIPQNGDYQGSSDVVTKPYINKSLTVTIDELVKK